MGLIVLQNLLESITSRGCEDTSCTLAIAPPPKLLYLYAVWKQHSVYCTVTVQQHTEIDGEKEKRKKPAPLRIFKAEILATLKFMLFFFFFYHFALFFLEI